MDELPPLPAPEFGATAVRHSLLPYVNSFSAEQMLTFRAEGVAAERQRCIDIVETYAVSVGNSRAGEMAAEWTMSNLREVRDAIRSQ